MRLPLYPRPQARPAEGGLLAAVEGEAPRLLDRSCRRCPVSSMGTRTVCMADDGQPGGVLLVGEKPGSAEDEIGRPNVGRSGKILRAEVAKSWSGPVVYSNAIRCHPGGGEDATVQPGWAEACRGYLSQTIREGRFTKVVALGAWAAYSILGRRVDPFSVRRGYGWLVGPPAVPVFFVTHPAAGLRNRFVMRWFREDLAWALSSAPPCAPPIGAVAWSITTPEEAAAAVLQLRAAPHVTLDCEWSGAQYSEEFTLLNVSCTPGGRDEAYVWDLAALADQGCRAPLAELMRDPAVPKIGSNLKSDHHAIDLGGLGPLAGVAGDVQLMRKLLESDADGHLNVMTELVGMGGHKAEAQGAKKTALEKLDKQIARKDSSRDQFALFAAPRAFPEIPERLEALCEQARRRKDETDSFIYALIPAELRARYNGRDTVGTDRLYGRVAGELAAEPELLRTWQELVLPMSVAVKHIEAWGVGVSREAMSLLHEHLAAKIAAVAARITPYGINPESRDDKEELLFKRLGLEPVRATKTGFSTDKDTLKELKGKHPVVDDLLEYSHLSTMDKNYGRGLPPHIRKDGRIHATIRLDGTVSGRPSCVDPNLMNVKTPDDADDEEDDGKLIRDCFVAPPGKVLGSLDYKQGEPHVSADEAGDMVMLAIFEARQDFHLSTAKLIAPIVWGLKPEDVKKYPHRDFAKKTNLAVGYGMSDESLAERLKCSLALAAKVRAAIMGKFTKLSADHDRKVLSAQKTGFCWVTWAGGRKARRRNLWQIADEDSLARSSAEISSYNTPYQGRLADYTNRALVAIVKEIVEGGLPAKLVLTIYDQILLEFAPRDADEVLGYAKEIMTEQEVDNGVPMQVDVEWGEAWGSLEKWKPAAENAQEPALAGGT